MDFHPDKCSTLHVTRSRTPILQDYILKGHKLTSEASSKYLGVELHSDMSWMSHIDKTVKKAIFKKKPEGQQPGYENSGI
jgi:hypothetical protein